jgi:hypothetical protein
VLLPAKVRLVERGRSILFVEQALMPTEKLDAVVDAIEEMPDQLTFDEAIASLRCVECDGPIEGDRADCAALRCHDCA